MQWLRFPPLLLMAALLASPASAQYVCPVEPNHSTVGFSVPIAGGLTRVTGKFTAFKAEILYDDQDVTRSSVSVTIQAASINTGIPDRDQDLRGPQFFDVERYPEITFRSSRVEKHGKKYVAAGELSMRGVTRPIELPFVITGVQRDAEGRLLLGASVRLQLNRQDFGVGSGWKHSLIPNFIGDQVGIEIDLWTRPGRKQEKAP